MRMLAALALAAAALGASAGRAGHPPSVVDAATAESALADLAVDEDRHAADYAELERLRAEHAAMAQPPSSGVAGARARRAAVKDRFWALIADVDALCEFERESIDGIHLAQLGFGVKGSPAERAGIAAVGVRLAPLDSRHPALCRREDELAASFKAELMASDPAWDAALQREAEELKVRRAFPWLAGAAGLLAALIWPLWRRRPPTLPAPSLVSRRFEARRLLSRDAAGETYEALDRTLGRPVALKLLAPELVAEPAEAARLLAAARAAAALKHPNIVELHSVERDGGLALLVFEMVEGRTLAEALADGGPLPFPRARDLLAEAASAFDAAHARGLLHRALTPASLVLARSGELRVAGFGFAAEARRTLARRTRRPPGDGLAYLAPEAELGAGTAAADVWSLAACFYEMLTRRPPFTGEDSLALKRAGRWAPPSSLAPGLPPGVDALFAVAFAPEPARRFPTAGALAGAVGAQCRGCGARRPTLAPCRGCDARRRVL